MSGRTRACDALRQKPHQEAGFSPAVFTSGLCGPMTGAPLSLCTAPSLDLPVSPFLLPQEWGHEVTWLGQITLESIVLVAPGGCFQGNLTFSCSLKATCGCGYTCELTLRVGRFLGRKTVMMERTEVMTAQTQILQTRFRHGRHITHSVFSLRKLTLSSHTQAAPLVLRGAEPALTPRRATWPAGQNQPLSLWRLT